MDSPDALILWNNAQALVLTPAWFVNMPKYGILRFDFVSTSRPQQQHIRIPERRFQVQCIRPYFAVRDCPYPYVLES